MIGEELDEASKLYRKTLEDKLVSKFKKEFCDKIGYTPEVITIYKDNEPFPKIALDRLIDLINSIMERRFGDKRVNKKLVRITSFLRIREATEYRFIYFKLAREMGYTLSETGRSLKTDKTNGYDHSTVMYGISTFDNLLGTSKQFALKYQEVLDEIKKKILNN